MIICAVGGNTSCLAVVMIEERQVGKRSRILGVFNSQKFNGYYSPKINILQLRKEGVKSESVLSGDCVLL